MTRRMQHVLQSVPPAPKYKGKAIPMWMEAIHKGKVLLPIFQRSYVWPTKNVVSLIETILLNRTMGTLLVLENDHNFPAVNLSGAPEISDAADDASLILDGQQRLTALWRAFGGHNGSRSDSSTPLPVFVHVEKWLDDQTEENIRLNLTTEIEGDVKLDDYKKFLNEPQKAYQAKCFPVNILAEDGIPTVNSSSLRNWCVEVFRNDAQRSHSLATQIDATFGVRLQKYKIWYHPMPPETDMKTAIKVFILTNNTSMKVSTFDIAVAYHDKGNYSEDMEKEDGLRFRIGSYLDSEQKSGKEVMISAADLSSKQRMIPRYGDHLLKLACIVSDKPPSDKNFVKDTTVTKVLNEFDSLNRALAWSADIIKSQGFPLRKYLPSLIPLRVLPATYLKAREHGVCETPKFMAMCRAYFWRALLTRRYERDANGRLFNDYRCICDMIESNAICFEGDDNVFDVSAYPYLKLEQLSSNDRSDKSLRNIICGIGALDGKDFATREPISSADNDRWDYHHLFPKKYLQDNEVPEKFIDHCLNFVLLRKDTNTRLIGMSPPHDYLSKTTRLVEGVNLEQVRSAVETHLIPLAELAADPKDIGVQQTYTNFIRARAKIIANKIEDLCRGH